MRHEVRLYTDCGELLLQGAAAERAAQVVERVLYARLRQLQREARRGRRTRCEDSRVRYGSGEPSRIDRRAVCGRAIGHPFIHSRPGGLE